MSKPILLKRSSVPNKVPTISDLQAGELALNTADKKLYFGLAAEIVKVLSALDVDTDILLLENSDLKIPSQKAVKNYIDSLVSGFRWKTPVRVKTTEPFASPTYNNGTDGVGATLTGATNGAFPAIDGVTLVLNDRVLVDRETSALTNGIYELTDLGSASTSWVLTRTTDADTPIELYSATVLILEGTVFQDQQWTCTTDAITIGTTAIIFVLIVAGAAIYMPGFGLGLTANTFEITDPELVALANLVSAPNSLPYFTGIGTAALTTITPAARSLLDDASSTAMRVTLGLVIGTAVQAQSDKLQAIDDLIWAPNKGLYLTSVNELATFDFTMLGRTFLASLTDIAARETIAAAARYSIPSVKTSNYTLTFQDSYDVTIEMDMAAANTVTIPLDVNTNLPVGSKIPVIQIGEGITSITSEMGVTLRSLNGNPVSEPIAGRYGVVCLYKRAPNDWVISGDIT